MHDPKGGDQPAYQPPAETTPYGAGNPPAEQPPTYQKPPTDPPPTDPPPYGEPPDTPPEEPPCEPPTGDCKCKEWPIDNCPTEAEPCRRLLEKFENILEGFAKDPTDATKKFADDLKEADKEYQGVNAAVKKYKEFYDKLDCKLAEAANWKKDLDDWVAGKLSDAEKAAIEESRKTNYTDKEKKICCDWLQCRDYYNSMLDCLEQSKKKEDEAKDNYEGIKGLEKTLGDRFADLKSLYDKAKGLRDEERYRAVYAVTLEYNDVYEHLSELRDWDYARGECSIDTGAEPSSAEPLTGDLKKDWTPEKFKTELLRRLRLLVLAKYQRFRWHQDFLSRSTENQKKKEACEKIRKERRDKFIQEADDITPPDGGGGGGGGYGQEPPTGEYPEEQPPETPPTKPPYQGGNDPGYPPGQPPPPPPTQQYPRGEQPKYQEPPPPPDKYRGRQKS